MTDVDHPNLQSTVALLLEDEKLDWAKKLSLGSRWIGSEKRNYGI